MSEMAKNWFERGPSANPSHSGMRLLHWIDLNDYRREIIRCSGKAIYDIACIVDVDDLADLPDHSALIRMAIAGQPRVGPIGLYDWIMAKNPNLLEDL